MKGTTYRRCGCKDPDTGKPYNQNCPDLEKRRHGTWTLDTRIDTTDRDQRRLKRGGYETQKEANTALDHIGDLLKLAGDDKGAARRIGDLIFTRKRGADLPSIDDVRRKLGAGADLQAPDVTVAEWLEEWFAGKRKLKKSTRTLYRGHLDHYLIPMLGGIARDKLQPSHIAGMFDRIDEWNEELLTAKDEGRAAHLPDDKRKQSRIVGNASQHRVLATLRAAYNAAVKRPGMIDWNPCLAVELPSEERDPARVWSPDQVNAYLDHTAEDRLAVLWRIILLLGPRRGEAIGIREADLDDDNTGATIRQTILEVGGEIIFDTPKSKAGSRRVSFDPETTRMVGERRKQIRREKLAAGEAYQDHGLLLCNEDGTPLRPGGVSYRFQKNSAAAGNPVIKLHEGRHTAATLHLEGGVDIKVVSTKLGHSTTRITQDLYTHVREAVQDKSAGAVVTVLEEARAKRKSSTDTGS